jgi:hypothetical protein
MIWLQSYEKVPETERRASSTRAVKQPIFLVHWWIGAQSRRGGRIGKWSSMPITHELMSQRWRNNFWSRTQSRELLIQPIHQILHREASISSATSRNFWQDKNFPIERHFSERSMRFRGGIEKGTSESVFLEWMERLRRYINTDGEYVD